MAAFPLDVLSRTPMANLGEPAVGEGSAPLHLASAKKSLSQVQVSGTEELSLLIPFFVDLESCRMKEQLELTRWKVTHVLEI
jgi:hypothetical protein